jgi:putative nucleotidyltransferase with HDIG domain
MRELLMHNSSPPRDDGPVSISPDRGRVQVATVTAPTQSIGAGASAAVPLPPNSLRMFALLGALVAATFALAVGLVLSGYTLGSPWMVLALALLGAAAERGSIRLSSNVEVSIAILPTLFAAVVLGPLAAMVVSGASMLGHIRPPYVRWGLHTFTGALNGGLTGLLAVYVQQLTSSTVGSIALATLACAAAAQVFDFVLACVTVSLRRSANPRTLLQIFLPVFPSALVLYVAIVGPLALAYVELSPWAALLFLFPALAAQRLFTMYQEQRRLATDLSAANQSLVRANLSFASALVTTLDARDRYTAGHSAAVAVYARDIAGRMELPQETQHLAHLSGLLHDIGKVGVPPGVLEKNGPLTLQERRKMEEHSVIGERILANVEAYSEIALIVRHHHERIDGEGYPDGIVGTEIPLISRIICVADAYNAMTSDRPYRDAMEVAVARGRLLQAAGSQFDPEVIAAFDQILETASDTYSSGARADFALEAQAHPELSPNLEVSAA